MYLFGRLFARDDGDLSSSDPASRYYSHTDHTGSVVAVSSPDAALLWANDYEPFGRPTEAFRDEQGFFFTGKDYDSDTGLYYFNARWYDAGIGRFITEDPARDGGNWYAYVANNPLRYVDPTGFIHADQ